MNAFDEFDTPPETDTQPASPVGEAADAFARANAFDEFDVPQQKPNAFDEFDKPGQEVSTAGAIAGNAALSAAPTVGGILAGAATGAAIGLATPAAPVTALVGGLAGGLAAAGIISKGQQWALDIMGLGDDVADWNRRASEQHPIASEVGALAPMAAVAAPVAGAQLALRGTSAALMGGISGVQQLIQEGKVDPTKVALSAAAGAALPGMRPWASSAAERGAVAMRSKFSRAQTPAQDQPGTPGRPDIKSEPTAQDTLMEEARNAPYAEDIEIGPPAPDKATQDTANDLTTVAKGVAAENPPAPKLDTVGNPVGAPTANRVASRPNEPGRNYQKGSQDEEAIPDFLRRGPNNEVPNVPIQEGPAPDVLAAIKPVDQPTPRAVEQPTPRSAAGNVPEPAAAPLEAGRTPQEPAAVPAADQAAADQATIDAVIQRARARQAAEPPPAPEPAKPVTAAVSEPELTAHQQSIIAEARQLLKEAHAQQPEGRWGYLLERLNREPPQSQAKRAADLLNALKSKSGEAKGREDEAKAWRPTERPTVPGTGAMARSHADAARKQAQLDVVMNARKQHVDTPLPQAPTELRAWAQRVIDDATKANEGVHPLSRDSHQPAKKATGPLADAFQWLRAVRDVSKAATPKNINRLKTLHKSETAPAAGKAMAELDAETKAIEDNSKFRPVLTEPAAEAVLAKVKGGEEAPRHDFDPFDNPRAANVKEHNQLRNWINNLDDVDYRLLVREHPDLVQNVNTTTNPAKLQVHLEAALEQAQMRRPGVIEPVPAEDVTGKAKPVAAENMKWKPTKPGAAASPGRKIEGAELERLKAQYTGGPKPKAETPATTNEALYDKAMRFAGDTSGAGKIPEFLKRAPEWFKPDPHNAQSTASDPGTDSIVRSISDDLYRMDARVKNNRQRLQANMALAPDLDKPTWTRIYHAQEDRGNLPADLQKVSEETTGALQEQHWKLYNDLRDLHVARPDIQPIELPDPKLATTKGYVPRFSKDANVADFGGDASYDPITGRTMSIWNPNMEERSWFALENPATGERMAVLLSGNKNDGFELTRWTKGVANKLKSLPSDFAGKLGDTIEMKVKGTPGKWMLDQATVREIRRATDQKLDFHENPVYAWSMAVDNLHRALENAKLKMKILDDPRFKAMTTTNFEEAKKLGYAVNNRTTLPEFEKYYMPDKLRWLFDDWHRMGFGPNAGLDAFRNFANNVLKVFYTASPFVHALNELDLFTVSRGFDWIKPQGYRNLARFGAVAFKSVNTQDHLQAHIREAGGNPMLGSVSLRHLWPEMMRKFGMDLPKDPGLLGKKLIGGLSARELGTKAYDLSSDVTWRLSDYLLTIRYLENLHRLGGDKAVEDVLKGKHSPLGREVGPLTEKAPAEHAILPMHKEAIERTHEFISDYRLPQTVLGSRPMQQFISDPAFTAFGRYKYAIFKSYERMLKGALKGDWRGVDYPVSATTGEKIKAHWKAREDAIGQMLVQAGLLFMAYPALDWAAQKLSGNEDAEFRRRGVSTILHEIPKTLSGERGLPTAHIWTPSVPLKTIGEIGMNRDYRGQPVVPSVDWTDPRQAGDALVTAGNYALSQFVPPYGQISGAYSRQEDLGEVGKAMLGEQFGVTLPSDRAVKYRETFERRNTQQEKARRKHPGVIPDMYYWLTQ